MSRELKKQQTREKILVTAEGLFAELGYEAVSTRMIAKHCEIGVGTVFAHFADKKLLTQALFHRKIEQQLVNQPTSLTPSSGLAFFIQSSTNLYHFYAEDRAFSIALLQNSIFDLEYFENQMDEFLMSVAQCLTHEMPTHTGESRNMIAKAWFGYYFFNLITGIAREDSKPEEWAMKLESDCVKLLSLVL